MDNEFNQVPVFEDGIAQPVFPFTDGRSGEDYDPQTSAVVRYCVYVESDYDTDGDGRNDLIKALIQVPRSAAEGNYRAATVFEARPYCAGVNADGYDHMKEVESAEFPEMDIYALTKKVCGSAETGNARETVCVSAMDAAMQADHADWYYPDKGSEGSFCYENLDNFNYYLVRGFAVVASAGFGALGSDGIEFVGSHYERDAFRFVVEWLHGDRIAYTDRNRTAVTKADWSNGKVAMTGRSYAGTMPFAVAVTGVPGLETIIPVAGISDWYSFLNQQGAQRYWPKEMLMSFLSYYCTSRYNDDLSEEQREQLDRFHHQLSLEQMKTGFDYSDFWNEGNYTLEADGIKCPALIVHGLHDENVSTKQFEMMLKSFEKAGACVKAILHQGPHITPTMPNKSYGIMVDGQFYDDIVNRWISHYLYGIENGAEDMPAVLVQSNLDQNRWETADKWDTGLEVTAASNADGVSVIDTDWAAAGIDQNNFDEKMCTASGNMNRRYISEPLSEALTIQGTVRVDFTASLAECELANGLCPENVNDADKLSFGLGDSAGRMDDVKLTVLLCELADEPFESFQTTDPERNVVPVRTVSEGGLPLGGDLAAIDIKEFEPVKYNYSVLTRAYIDLCNPESGYEPETSAAWITLVKGDKHNYHVYLNPTRCTIPAGHRLAVVIGTEDPVNCLIHKKYSVAVDNASVKAVLPVTEVTASLQLNI